MPIASVAIGERPALVLEYIADEFVPFSERCRILAQECRVRAETFRNEPQRVQMLQLAADYDRKARQAEAIEESLRNMRTSVT